MAPHYHAGLLFGAAVVIAVHAHDVATCGIMNARVLTILDPNRRDPLPKFPGGRGKGEEQPEAVAMREVQEETGLTVAIDGETTHVDQERHDHFVRFFLVEANLDEAERQGDENGEPVIVQAEYTLGSILAGDPKILPQHRKGLELLCEELRRRAA